MKKLLATIIILVLASVFVSAQSRPDNRRESLRERLERIEQKIEELEIRIIQLEILNKPTTIETKKSNSSSLKSENMETKSGKLNEEHILIGALKQPIFGIYLGETLDSLKKRKTIAPSKYQYTDKDNPSKLWDVENYDSNIKNIIVSTYQEIIYEISIYFIDASETNYAVIKKQLQEKYLDRGDEGLKETIFSEINLKPIVDGIQLIINLNFDNGIFEEDSILLRYVHYPLIQKLTEHIEKNKASKVKNNL